jgi:hypothetical protein
MNNIEKNAMKIAELLGHKIINYNDPLYGKIPNCIGKVGAINKFSNYNRLMRIIESEISEYELKNIHFELKTDSLLEAVQNFVIRYLELKNG